MVNHGLTRRIASTAAMVLGCVGITLLAGCPFLSVLGTAIGTSPFRIVGTDGNQMLFVENKDLTDSGLAVYPPGPDGAVARSRDLRITDLATLETETARAGVAAFSRDIAANNRWIAWVNREDESVSVLDRQAGTESTHLAGLIKTGNTITGTLKLMGDRLVVHTATTDAPTASDSYDFILLDLASGEYTTISDSWYYATCAISDEFFAFMDNLPTDTEHFGLELTTNIQVVNLTTGEQKVVAPNRHVAGDGSALFISNGQLIWQEFKQGGSQTKVCSYDLQTGEITTLAVNFHPGGGGFRNIEDISGDRILVMTRSGLPLTGYTYSLEIRTFGGEITPLIEFPNTLGTPHQFTIAARFVGDYVVWDDPISGEFVIYDINAQTTRQFDPDN